MANAIENIYPLSPMQQGMLFHTLLEPSAKLYCEQLMCRVKGVLDLPSFRKAWTHIVDTNPILRTVFDWESKKFVQIVLRKSSIEFDYLDITKEKGKEHFIKQEDALDLAKGFDLEYGPLIRFKLYKLAKDNYVFRMSYHHIILDGTSLPFLFEDFFQIYTAVVGGKALPLSCRKPYEEYIRWLIERKTNNSSQFWKKYLNGYYGFSSSLKSNIAHTQKTSAVCYKKTVIPDSAVEKLEEISKQFRITINNLTQVVWGINWGNQNHVNDVVFGSTITDRHPELEGSGQMIGMFLGTLPMRLKIDGEQSFIYHAKSLQANWLEMQEHSHLPLYKIKKLLGIKANESLFQSIFTYSAESLFHNSKHKASTLNFALHEYRELTNYNFTVDVTYFDKLTFQLSYPKGVVGEKNAESIVEGYKKLLLKFVDFPETPIKKLISKNVQTDLSIVGFVKEKTSVSIRKVAPNGNDTRSLVEKDVAEIWKEVLGAKDISTNDNFFELGGDSISSIRVVSKLVHKGYQTSIKQMFENPTIRSLSLAIVESECNEKKRRAFKIPKIIGSRVVKDYKNNVENIMPVSFVQKYILSNSLRDQTSLYHDQSSFEYQGEIDYNFFEDAWNHVVYLNPMLRTIFYWDAEVPFQVVLKKSPVKLDLIDLSDKPKAQQEDHIEHYKLKDIERRFDFKKGPLLRITLFKLNNSRHIFFLSFNVITMDGWCFALVLNDFYEYYKALVNGVRLPSFQRAPYSEYITWLCRQDVQRALGYWKAYLQNTKFRTYIRREEKKVIDKKYNIGSQKITLPYSFKKRLENIAKRKHITPNMIFQVAWAYLLRNISNEQTIVIGATVSGRPPELPKSDKMVGLFFNDIPVKYEFGEKVNFFEITECAQREFSESRQHEYISSQQILKALQLSDQIELFQTLVVFENYPKQEELLLKSKNKAYMTEVSNWRRETSNIDITIYIELTKQVVIDIRYLQNLFSPERIKKILDEYENILMRLV